MKINFKTIFGTTLVIVLVGLFLFSLFGAPAVAWVKSKLNLGGGSTYDGTPMAFDGSQNRVSAAELRRRVKRMRAEAAENFSRNAA